jgi:hypothetical protein
MLLAPCIGPGWVCRGVQSLDESGSPRKPGTARGTNVPWVRWYIRAVCTVCEPVLLSRSRFRIGLVAAPSSVEPTHTSYPSPPSHPPSDVSVLFLAPDMQTGGPVLPACGFLVHRCPLVPLSTSSETDTTHGGLGGSSTVLGRVSGASCVGAHSHSSLLVEGDLSSPRR